MLMYIVISPKYFDLNKTVALRTGIQRKKTDILQIFIQNISVLDK